jgi:hypothetical protein
MSWVAWKSAAGYAVITQSEKYATEATENTEEKRQNDWTTE